MPAVALCGVDMINTGHGCDTTALIQGSLQTKVSSGGHPIAVLGDAIQIHEKPDGSGCDPHAAFVSGGSSKVFIGGLPIARVGDAADAGSIATGSGSISAG